MIGRRTLSLTIAFLAACGGLPVANHPLYIARAADSAAAAPTAPRLSLDRNSITLEAPASAVTGCAELSGEYVRKGGTIDVALTQVASQSQCDPANPRPFITRIGPLPPGSYSVTVTLDGKPFVRSEFTL